MENTVNQPRRYNYYWWDAQIEKASCRSIIAAAEKFGEFKPGIVGDDTVKKNIRDNDVTWLSRMHTVECILAHHAYTASESMGWSFDLTGVHEPTQIARYIGNKKQKQFYGLHNDLRIYDDGSRFERKMTAILLLSDPKDFVGGDLYVEDELVEHKKQGSIIVFPTFMPHQVTPVTKGTRYTATCWIAGPRFK